MNQEYETWRGVYQAGCDAQQALEAKGIESRMDWERAEAAVKNGVRRFREALIRAGGITPTTVLGFGLYARIVAAELSEWWDDNELQEGERACRALLDQLMSAAGVGHMGKPACLPDEILAYTRPEKA